MRYYAHFGHKEFILCLGYGAHHIKDYFLDYRETESNDFVLREGEVELQGSDIADWTIHFVHTGLESPIGERLRRVRHLVEDEEMFLANYADVLTDAPLDRDGRDVPRQRTPRPRCSPCRRRRVFHIVDVDRERPRELDLPGHRHARSGRTGATSRCAPRSIDHIPENGDLVGDACTQPREGGPAALLPLRRLLAARGHAQGAQRARGGVPGRHAPLDALGATSPSARRWRASSTQALGAPGG